MEDKTHIRLKILKALTNHLAGVTIVNGYDHNLSGSVFRGRSEYGKNDPLPMVSILEGKGSDIGQFADDHQIIRKDTWTLLLQGFVDDDKKNPTDPAYALLADVERRLSDIVALDKLGKPEYPGVYMLRGLVTSLMLASPVVRPPEEGLSSKAFFYLPVRVGLAVNLKKPWHGSKEINQ